MIRFGKSTVRELSALLMNREVSDRAWERLLDRIKEYDPQSKATSLYAKKRQWTPQKSAVQSGW